MHRSSSPTSDPASRRGAVLPPLLTAAGVLAAILVSELLLSGLSAATALPLPGAGDAATLLTGFGVSAGLVALPFALGVFAALWLVAPIRGAMPPLRVVVRALVAAAVGAAVAIVVAVVVAIVQGASGALWFSASFPDLGSRIDGFGYAVLTGVVRALGALVTWAPIVVLGGIALRSRLGRADVSEAPRDGVSQV